MAECCALGRLRGESYNNTAFRLVNPGILGRCNTEPN